MMAIQKKHQWLILLGGVLLLVVSNAINFGPEDDIDWRRQAGYLLMLALSIAMQFFTLLAFGQWMQGRLPGLSHTRRRVVWAFLIGVPLLAVLVTLSDVVMSLFSDNPVYEFGWKTLLLNLTQSAVTTIFILGFTEAFYHYEQLHQSEKEKEELRRIGLYAQYDSLKQQVNPHFLFNSLNSLSSLIAIDPPRAEKFVEEMSQVYRYLLQSNEQELTTLGRELEFIKSYLHLLKTRFGDGFQVSIDIAAGAMHRFIPPLTLQLLVENTVKHNEISTASPLRLQIVSQGDERLVVSNNLQRRSISMPSNKIGLANVITRYRLLDHPDVEVREEEQMFTVSLPLIKRPE